MLGQVPTHIPLGSPLIRLPSTLTINGASCPAAFLESITCLGTLTSNAAPFAWGLTARSRLFLEGSDNISTSEPSSTLYWIGTDFPKCGEAIQTLLLLDIFVKMNTLTLYLFSIMII